MRNVVQENEKAISGAIKIDEKEIRTHLDGLVRQSVEDTLNVLLNAEADAICRNQGISAVRIGRIRDPEAINEKIYGKIEEWRKQPMTGEHPYVFVDGVYLKRSWGERFRMFLFWSRSE